MHTHPKQSITHLLMHVVNRITASVNQELKPWGLSLTAARVLVCLHLDEAATVGDLACAADVDQSTLSHMLRRLQHEGLLTRARLESDNRAVRVTLTAQGREAATRCAKTLQHHDRLLLKSLDAVTETQVRHLLLELIENTRCFEERARLLAARRDRSKPGLERVVLD